MAKASPTLDGLRIEPLGPETWDAFAALIERHHGIFGGCWCTWFHDLGSDKRLRAEGGEDNRAFKQRLVHEGKATRPSSSTATAPSPGASTGTPRNCPTSITARNTTRRRRARPTTG